MEVGEGRVGSPAPASCLLSELEDTPAVSSKILWRLHKILDNVVKHPEDERWQTLRLLNPLIRELWSDARCRKILLHAGFGMDTTASCYGHASQGRAVSRNAVRRGGGGDCGAGDGGIGGGGQEIGGAEDNSVIPAANEDAVLRLRLPITGLEVLRGLASGLERIASPQLLPRLPCTASPTPATTETHGDSPNCRTSIIGSPTHAHTPLTQPTPFCYSPHAHDSRVVTLADYEDVQTDGSEWWLGEQEGLMVCQSCGRSDLYRDTRHRKDVMCFRASDPRIAVWCGVCKWSFMLCGGCYNRGNFAHTPEHRLVLMDDDGMDGSGGGGGVEQGEEEAGGFVSRKWKKPVLLPSLRDRPRRGPWG